MVEEEHEETNETHERQEAKERIQISIVELSVKGDRVLGSQIVETPFIRSVNVSRPPMLLINKMIPTYSRMSEEERRWLNEEERPLSDEERRKLTPYELRFITHEEHIKSELKSGELPGWLARGSYHILPFNQLLPDRFFHHKDVKKKLDRMKNEGRVEIGKMREGKWSKANIVQEDINVNQSNRDRIPDQEEYPYYTRTLMIVKVKSLAAAYLPKGSYSIYKIIDQPTSVFFKYPPKVSDGGPELKISKKFKIHLMFNAKYMDDVLHRLFNELIKEYIKAEFPVLFKLLRYSPVTSVINRAGLPNPLFIGLEDYDYDYGVNSAEKKKYGRLAESFIYSPTDIKKYQVAFGKKDSQPKSSTFTLKGTTKDVTTNDGTTKMGKDINERYDMETVFDPMIVFYINDDEDPDYAKKYTRELLQNLLTIFPDETTQEWVLPNFYPRGNVKINNMIYLANGDFDRKDNENMKCTYPIGGEPICELDPAKGKLLNIPTEYQTIQDSCSRLPPDQCNAANRFPLAVSNHKLCKLEEGQCKPQKTYSQHLLLQDYASLKELYEAVDKLPVLERFEAGTENGSLPNNYGGRRTRRNKRNKRKTRCKRKNKSRRAHSYA